MMAAGVCDAAVVGGVDSLCLTTLYGFNSLGLTSRAPCRPYDVDRDGISIGEGAGFALLEKTARQVFDNPKYREEYAKTGAPVETIQYGDRALCTKYSNDMIALANEYRELLTAKPGKG